MTSKWTWQGWSWGFVGLTVVIMAVLQVLLQYVAKYSIVNSLPLALLIVAYIVIPRVQERKLGNAILGVLAMFVVGVVLMFTVDIQTVHVALQQNVWWQFISLSLLFPLVLGLVMSYLYLRLTTWSDKKRAEMEAKRREKQGVPATPPVRRHHKKRKKKR